MAKPPNPLQSQHQTLKPTPRRQERPHPRHHPCTLQTRPHPPPPRPTPPPEPQHQSPASHRPSISSPDTPLPAPPTRSWPCRSPPRSTHPPAAPRPLPFSSTPRCFPATLWATALASTTFRGPATPPEQTCPTRENSSQPTPEEETAFSLPHPAPNRRRDLAGNQAPPGGPIQSRSWWPAPGAGAPAPSSPLATTTTTPSGCSPATPRSRLCSNAAWMVTFDCSTARLFLSVRTPIPRDRRAPRAPQTARAAFRTAVSQVKQPGQCASHRGADSIRPAATLSITRRPETARRRSWSIHVDETSMMLVPRRNPTYRRFPRTERHRASSRYQHNATEQSL